MAGNFIGLVFGTLKENGIDTSDMSVEEAIEKFRELGYDGVESNSDASNNTPKVTKYKSANKQVQKQIDEAIANYYQSEENRNIIGNIDKLGEVNFQRAKKSNYSPSSREISIDANARLGTIYHEIGHSIDHLLGQQKEGEAFEWISEELDATRNELNKELKNSIPETLVQKSKEISEELVKEVKDKYIQSGELMQIAMNNIKKRYGMRWNSLSDGMKNILGNSELQVLVQKKLTEISKNNDAYNKWGCVCDIYDAVTNGTGYGSNKLLQSHGFNYYNSGLIAGTIQSGKSKKQNAEILANYIEMRMGNYTEQLKYINETSPKLAKQLDTLYKSIGDKLKGM